MKTSLSIGCTPSSSRRDNPGMSPISELFHGTMTSDFGASWLPRIEMPESVLTSDAAAAEASGCALASVFALVAAFASVASCASAAVLADANRNIAMKMWRDICLLPAPAVTQIRQPLHDILVVGRAAQVSLVVGQRTTAVGEIQV